MHLLYIAVSLLHGLIISLYSLQTFQSLSRVSYKNIFCDFNPDFCSIHWQLPQYIDYRNQTALDETRWSKSYDTMFDGFKFTLNVNSNKYVMTIFIAEIGSDLDPVNYIH